MPTRPFDNSNFATRPVTPLSPSFQMSSYAVPLTRPRLLEERERNPEAASADEAVVNLRLLGRGVVWGLAIEGAAALCACVAWHLWSVLR